MPFLPYSPRWLFQQGRNEEAWRVLDSFNMSNSSEKEKEELRAKMGAVGVRETQATIGESFKDPKARWRTILGMFASVTLSCVRAFLCFDAGHFYSSWECSN